MKVLNVIWGFTPGGVGKCFLTYCGIGRIEPKLEMVSVCINLKNTEADTQPLADNGVQIIEIRNRKDFSWIKRLNALIGLERPDLIFTHGFNGPVAVLLCRLSGGEDVPMVCSYHSEYHPMTKIRRLFAPVFNGVMHFVYRRKALAVLGVSEYTVKMLTEKYKIPANKVSFVYNGIADVKMQGKNKPIGYPNIDENEVVFALVSRLDPVKGIDMFLHAFKLALEKNRSIELIVIGDGPERQRLKELACDYEIDNKVHFVGIQSNVDEWMANIDVYCLPSVTETFALSLVEAMRAGKASIVSGVGGVLEVATNETSIVMHKHDYRDWSNAICHLSKDWELRSRLGESARKRFLDNFTEEKMMRGVADWLLKNGCGNA